jgi:hypothetical protein
MTSRDSNSSELIRPPDWMVGLLRLLLRPVDQQTVFGDLLEEYRESVVPARGRSGADFWFLRQVAGFAWRATFLTGLLLWAFTTGRFLLDTFSPPTDWGPRSAVTTWLAVGLFVLAGFWSAWRTGHTRSAVVVTVGTHLIGWGLNIAVTAAVFLSVLRSQPELLAHFEQSGGWGETIGLPVMLLPLVILLGLIGGLLGKALRSKHHPLIV